MTIYKEDCCGNDDASTMTFNVSEFAGRQWLYTFQGNFTVVDAEKARTIVKFDDAPYKQAAVYTMPHDFATLNAIVATIKRVDVSSVEFQVIPSVMMHYDNSSLISLEVF